MNIQLNNCLVAAPSYLSINAIEGIFNPATCIQRFIASHDNHLTSSWEKLYEHLVANKVIDARGIWNREKEAPMPPFVEAQKMRLNQLFNITYTLSLDTEGAPPTRKNIALNEIIASLGCTQIELIGSGVNWILGREFFKSFLSHFAPQELLTDDLFEEMSSFPQDFDFRINASRANPAEMFKCTAYFFNCLSRLLKIEERAIYSGCKKKWFSKENDVDKYAMATLNFYHSDDSGKKAFDVDFSFVKSLQREHLNKRDALSLFFQIPMRELPRIATSLKSIEEACAHYILRLLDADDSKTINPMGFATILVGTIKRRFPIKGEFLKDVYAHLQQRNLGHTLLKDLSQAISTHCLGHPKAILAAAFNAASLVDPILWKEILHAEKPGCRPLSFTGNSLLELFFNMTNPSNSTCSIEVLQNLLCVHAYLGMMPNTTIYHKKAFGFIEFQCRGEENERPLSIFIENKLAPALKELTQASAWNFIESLCETTLQYASLEGPLLPANFREEVIAFSTAAQTPAARKLALVLQLKSHHEQPVNKNVETLLGLFSTLIKDFTPTELRRYGVLLAETLVKASETHQKQAMYGLQAGMEILCSDNHPSTFLLAQKLLNTDDGQLCRIAHRILQDPLQGDEKAFFIDFIASRIENKNARAASLFLEFSNRLSLVESLPLFLKLLQNINCDHMGIFWEIGSLKKFSQKITPELTTTLPPEDQKALQSALQKTGLAPASKQTPVQKSPKNPLQSLIQFKTDAQKAKKPLEYIDSLVKKVKSTSSNEEKVILQETFKILFLRIENKETLIDKLLTNEIKSLYLKNPSELVTFYEKTLPLPGAKLDAKQTIQKNRVIHALIEAIKSKGMDASTLNPTIDLLINHFQSAPKLPKSTNKAPIQAVALALHNAGAYALLYKFLKSVSPLSSQGEWAKLASEILEKLINNLKVFAKAPPSKDWEGVVILENVYTCVAPLAEKERLKSRGSADAIAFVHAYLAASQPKKALPWAKKVTSPDPSLDQLLESLQVEGLLREHHELLTHKKGVLFSPKKLSLGWLFQASAENSGSPAAAAKIYIQNQALFSKELSACALVERVEALVKDLIASEDPHHKDLALELMTAHALASSPLWDEALQAANTLSKEGLAKAWGALKKFHFFGATRETRLKLMNAFTGSNYCDSALLNDLCEKQFRESPFYSSDAEEQAQMYGFLLTNALACIQEGTAPDLDFNTLNEIRKKYAPGCAIEEFIRSWLVSPHTAQIVKVLGHLLKSDVEYTLPLVPLSTPFVQALLQITENAAYKDSVNIVFYKYCMSILTETHPVATEALINLLKTIVPPLCQGACERSNPLLAELVLTGVARYKEEILKTPEDRKKFHSLILNTLPLIFLFNTSSKTQFILDELHPKVTDFKQLGKGAFELAQWQHYSALFAAMLKTKVAGTAQLQKVLSYSSAWLKVMISLVADSSKAKKSPVSQKDELRLAIDKFLYAEIFSVERALSENHLQSATEIAQLAISVFGAGTVSGIELCTYKGLQVNTMPTIGSASAAAAVFDVMRALMQDPSPCKMERVLTIFAEIGELFPIIPNISILFVKDLLKEISLQKLEAQTFVRWMQYVGLPLSFVVSSLENTSPVPDRNASYQLWSRATPTLIYDYLNTVHSYVKTNSSPQEDLVSILLAAYDFSQKCTGGTTGGLKKFDSERLIRTKLFELTLFHREFDKSETTNKQTLSLMLFVAEDSKLDGDEVFEKCYASLISHLRTHPSESGRRLFNKLLVTLAVANSAHLDALWYKRGLEYMGEWAWDGPTFSL